MRPLLLDMKAKKRIAEIVELSREDLYHPGKSETVPGNDARHIVKLFKGFRAVFSFTEIPEEGLYRHLTVSINGSSYPNVIAALMIAEAFGFTGWELSKGGELPPDWIADANLEDHCITLLQPVHPGEFPPQSPA